MKKIDITPISSVSGFPVKAGTLGHLQGAYEDTSSYLAQTLIQTSTPNAYVAGVVYALYGGGISTASVPGYILSSPGVYYYNGELFETPGAIIATTSNTYSGNIQTTYFTDPTADPVTFTDTSVHNVHQIRKIVVVPGTTGSITLMNNIVPLISPTAVTSPGYTVSIIGGGIGVPMNNSMIYNVIPNSTTNNISIETSASTAPGCWVEFTGTYSAGASITLTAAADPAIINVLRTSTGSITNVPSGGGNVTLKVKYLGFYNSLYNYEAIYYTF